MKLGTRGSLLARTQSQWVADRITEATGEPVELVIITTRGDQITDRPLQQVGGKGLFTKEIEDALLDGRVDIAVHSMKDMPTDQPKGLGFGAIPVREDPRDVLVGATLAELPEGAVVGTGSIRRAMQLRALRPDLDIRGIRGNVDTRIAKQRSGDYDAVVLARAGLARVSRLDDVAYTFSVEEMVPAVGQGALAVQSRRDDLRTADILERIHHDATSTCIAAERAFMAAVEGGCSVPAGCHAWIDGSEIVVTGVMEVDGELRRATLRTDRLHVHVCGREVARRVRA